MRIDVLRRMHGVCTKCGGSGFFYRVRETDSEATEEEKSRLIKVRCRCGVINPNNLDYRRMFAIEGRLLRAMLRDQDREGRG
jgi:hypothetical protein